jgi:hypothetical protein
MSRGRNQLPSLSISKWKNEDIKPWLESIEMEDYWDDFRESGLDGAILAKKAQYLESYLKTRIYSADPADLTFMRKKVQALVKLEKSQGLKGKWKDAGRKAAGLNQAIDLLQSRDYSCYGTKKLATLPGDYMNYRDFLPAGEAHTCRGIAAVRNQAASPTSMFERKKQMKDQYAQLSRRTMTKFLSKSQSRPGSATHKFAQSEPLAPPDYTLNRRGQLEAHSASLTKMRPTSRHTRPKIYGDWKTKPAFFDMALWKKSLVGNRKSTTSSHGFA